MLPGPEPILFVIDHFSTPTAGTEGQLFQLVNSLDRSRFAPHLLVFRDSEFLQVEGFPCEYTVLGSHKVLSVATWLALWKFARSFSKAGCRLAHVFFNDPSVVCPPVFQANGIKTIISRRDMGYWYTRRYLWMLGLSGRFVSAVITNSYAVKNVTLVNEPVSSKDIHVIYNGYSAGDGCPSPPLDLVKLRERSPEAVFAGIVANIRPIKRMADAIRAVGVVSARFPALHLVIIGGGESRELSRLAKDCGVHDRVHFLGARRDVKDCLAGIDIGLLCSESEGFSNSIVEYMQAGLPVVCSAVGGNPEAISHGETGFLYSCGNVDELAERLNDLVSNSELRAELGEKARAAARLKFSTDAMVQKHQEIYDALLSKE